MWKLHGSDRYYRQEKLKKGRQWERPPRPRCSSQGGHVIESMVKLLTDRFVLQLLSVQLVCRSPGQKARFSKKCRKTVQRKRRTVGDTKTVRRQQPKQLGQKTKEENRCAIEYRYESTEIHTTAKAELHLHFLFFNLTKLFFSNRMKQSYDLVINRKSL